MAAPWPAERCEAAMRLAATKPAREVAAILGVTVRAFWCWANEHGIPTRHRKEQSIIWRIRAAAFRQGVTALIKDGRVRLMMALHDAPDLSLDEAMAQLTRPPRTNVQRKPLSLGMRGTITEHTDVTKPVTLPRLKFLEDDRVSTVPRQADGVDDVGHSPPA
jgi:hypothetical protein